MRLQITLGLTLSVLLLSGCRAQQCDAEGDFPVDSLQCPAGQVCYQQRCQPACNSAVEAQNSCESDNDCTSDRPRCAAGQCTRCEDGTRCVPVLNICGPVLGAPRPDASELIPPRPPAPADGGVADASIPIEGGLQLSPDAGQPVDAGPIALTHVGLIDIAQEVELSSGTSAGVMSVQVIDTASATPGLRWRLDVSPPATVERVFDPEQARCFIERFSRPPNPRPPANIGEITIGPGASSPDAIDRRYTAAFDPQLGYTLDQAPALQLLAFSEPVSQPVPEGNGRFVSASSPGLVGLVEAWPAAIQQEGHFVPFALEPAPETRASLTALEIPPQTVDVPLTWNLFETGLAGTERISLRVLGDTHHLVCEFFEGREEGDLMIEAAALEEFRNRERPQAALPLRFERLNIEQLQIPETGGALYEVIIRIRHSFVGQISFR